MGPGPPGSILDHFLCASGMELRSNRKPRGRKFKALDRIPVEHQQSGPLGYSAEGQGPGANLDRSLQDSLYDVIIRQTDN